MALRVWLPLNGTLENQGLSNVTVTSTSNPSYITTDSKLNSALQLNVLQSIFCADLNYLTQFSIAFWAKVNSDDTLTAAWVDLLTLQTRNLAGDSTSYDLRWETCYDRTYGIGLFNNTSQSILNYNPGTANNKDEWVHISLVVDTTTVSEYRNGVLRGTWQRNGGSLTGNIHIGQTNAINGQINDLRIYDHCLSPKEVKEIAQGLILHYKLDGFSGGAGDNILTGTNNQTINRTQDNLNTTTNANGLWGWGSGGNGACTLLDLSNDSPLPDITHGFSVTNNTTGNRDYQQGKIPYKSGVKYTASWYARGTCKMLVRSWNSTDGKQMVSTSPNLDSTDWQYMTWTFTASEEMSTDFCTFHIGLTGAGSVEFCGMKLEEGSVATRWTPAPQDLNINTTILVDSSGYNHNAENINGNRTITDLEGRYNVASVFDGTNYYKTSLSFTSDQWTASCWYYKTTAPTGYESFLCLSKDSGSDANKKIYIGLNNNLIGAVAEGTWNSVSRTNLLNQWVFAALTYDGTTATLYENGESIKTFTDSTILTDCIDLTIGVRPSAAGAASVSLPFNGYLSDARIYATALSAEDILDLYHTSASVDNLGNMHRFEFVDSEGSREVFNDWTSWNMTSGSYNLSYDEDLGLVCTGRLPYYSGTPPYYEIKNSGYTYEYEIEYSTTGDNNWFLVGIEKYDADKTATSNNSTVYIISTRDVHNKTRIQGTVDLQTDSNNNLVKYIKPRILNSWDSAGSGNGYITYFSLREVPTSGHQIQQIYKNGIVKSEMMLEYNDTNFHKDGIIETKQFIEK